MASLKRYFIETTAPTAGEVRGSLWNEDAEATLARTDLVFEQYKLYVEMADRVSQRRGLANTFFLTLNTLIFTAVGVFWQDRPAGSPWLAVVPLTVLLLQCLAWFWIIRSYRQLNAAKWAVVGAIEERLPASPWWRAEWKAVGQGADPARYWPLTHVEQWIPFLFGLAYACGFLVIVLA